MTVPADVEVVAEPPGDVPVTGRLAGTDLRVLGGEPVPAEAARLRDFSGKVGETLTREAAGRLEIVTGAGDLTAAGETELRRVAATFARALAGSPAAVLDLRGSTVLGVPAGRLAQVVVEGVSGAAYRFDRYRSDAGKMTLERLVVVVDADDLEAAREGARRGLAVAGAVEFARHLVNTGPGDLTPRLLAERAAERAAATGVSIEVWDEERIVAERLGGLLGVARGSAEPPRLVTMTYEPGPGEGALPTVVLVGKGITFDSGGLSLKPPDSMIGMKADMSGAAAVLAAVSACPALGIRARVVAIAPVTENMPGGRAIKPGDVLRPRNGKTIEVLNTDAEGRLVLSDGLVLATERDPDAIVDLATLTGACVVALGSKVAGLMGNDSRVVGALEAAAARSGEALWRLPLPREYRKDIDSDIADMKNMGKARQAGALVAGLLLEEFVDERPWAHLDIAGPADSEEESYELRKGGTGFGVRTLLEFLEAFEIDGEPGQRRADHVGVG
ncbi:MAG TPA: leucyl aminopeptidase [Acidimicrobiales bacterium]|nr:leucyl aminopeptidase [Acidimicrobiales bacterium]